MMVLSELPNGFEMYERFFGFKERPFRLVPDPAYMFLARSHQEAMAHLVYAVGAGDGFVEVTGEVGTGKTTLCRAFLDQLKVDTEYAFIFNPPGDAIDLLQAVNRDFGLSTGKGHLQTLIQELNTFLIQKRKEDKKVLLLIDEAQNLNQQVLEQIRLLSNLETASGKLLQIILVGQPELHDTLRSTQLRQLRQRITLSCRLTAFSLAETEAYIRHRLKIASTAEPPVFTKGAVRRIFRFSGGIPRLINMACDRALLKAYTLNRGQVDATCAAKALQELEDNRIGSPKGRFRWVGAGIVAAAIVLAGIFLAKEPFLLQIGDAPQVETKSAPPSGSLKSAEMPTSRQGKTDEHAVPLSTAGAVNGAGGMDTAGVSANVSMNLDEWVQHADTSRTRSYAVKALVRRWVANPPDLRLPEHLQDDMTFFQISAGQAGLNVYKMQDRLEVIHRLDLPAILELGSEALGGRAYLVLSRIEGDRYLFFSPEGEQEVACDQETLLRLWAGRAYVLWKNFFAIGGVIPGRAPGESIITLKLLLRDLGYDSVDLSPTYDENTRQAVMDVQGRQALPIDGVVGPMTKIALYNLKPGLAIPKLEAR
jgi:general secretion pathway protein A